MACKPGLNFISQRAVGRRQGVAGQIGKVGGRAGEATNRLSAGSKEHHRRDREADHIHHSAEFRTPA